MTGLMCIILETKSSPYVMICQLHLLALKAALRKPTFGRVFERATTTTSSTTYTTADCILLLAWMIVQNDGLWERLDEASSCREPAANWTFTTACWASNEPHWTSNFPAQWGWLWENRQLAPFVARMHTWCACLSTNCLRKGPSQHKIHSHPGRYFLLMLIMWL